MTWCSKSSIHAGRMTELTISAALCSKIRLVSGVISFAPGADSGELKNFRDRHRHAVPGAFLLGLIGRHRVHSMRRSRQCDFSVWREFGVFLSKANLAILFSAL